MTTTTITTFGERTAPTHDEQARRLYEAGERVRREHDALRMLGRVV